MTASKTASAIRGRDAALEAFRAEGCSAPRSWSNGPGDTYGRHAHGFHKVLFCLDGSITFHLAAGERGRAAGDRLDSGSDTEHGATVGPAGCSCVEASR